MKILEVKNLVTNFKVKNDDLEAIRNISFSLEYGQTLGIVGESGSGKSVTVKTIMNILPTNGYRASGEILFENIDITKMTDEQFRKIQGNDITMIFQDPMTALNPLKTIGYHLVELLMRNTKTSRSAAKERALHLLNIVEIPNPEVRINEYPHQFSGGMRQRVMIAMSLACNPKLLIADEPTTALDVTIQSQILKLLKKIQQAENMAIILITHDLAVVYSMCENIIVMYGGKIMEMGSRSEIFESPKHPYTIALLNSIPKINSNKRLTPIEGIAPSLNNLPKGCPFEPRCDFATEECKIAFPTETLFSDTHKAFCYNTGGDLIEK